MFGPLFPRNGGDNHPGTSVHVLITVSILGRKFNYDSRSLFRGYRFSLLAEGTLNVRLLASMAPSVSACCLFHHHVYRCRREANVSLVRLYFRRLTNGRMHLLGVSNGYIHVSDGLVNDGVTHRSHCRLVRAALIGFLGAYALSSLSPRRRRQTGRCLGRSSSGAICHSSSSALRDGLTGVNGFVVRVLTTFPAASPTRGLLRHLFSRRCIMVSKGTMLQSGGRMGTSDLRGPGSPSTACHDGGGRGIRNCIAGVARAMRRNGPGVVASIRIRATMFTSYRFLRRTIRGDRHIAGSAVRSLCTSNTCRDPSGQRFTGGRGTVRLGANGVRNKYE